MEKEKEERDDSIIEHIRTAVFDAHEVTGKWPDALMLGNLAHRAARVEFRDTDCVGDPLHPALLGIPVIRNNSLGPTAVNVIYMLDVPESSMHQVMED